MNYSIKQLSSISGVSARTLRYYDEIGLLKPLYINQSGYRYYGAKQLEILQQILFYKERRMTLKQISDVIYKKDFDILKSLQLHLEELENEKIHLESLISTVKNTIAAMKGEYEMTDEEKFAVFKQKLIENNENTFGKEIRKKYGNEAVDNSNKNMLKMSSDEYENFRALESVIKESLKKAVMKKSDPSSEEGKEIAEFHKNWLNMAWGNYNQEAHCGLVEMYVIDERFKKYYDEDVDGCAKFLKDAVIYWFK